ncbi:MAG: mannose-1-phosphate guanylyltransferase [Candidatus Hydrogenedentes bacterium]|nr:mannose-1-phosphate guanylyltransferase [Candidatus Hydrogenedentota bacterium]
MSKRHAVVLCGGRGTRFWPKSRTATPKQILPIVSDQSLIKDVADRLRPVLPQENLWLLTTPRLVDVLRSHVDFIPPKQFLCDPVPRNTAPILGMAAVYLEHRTPGAVMGSFHADAAIGQVGKFRKLVRAAYRLAERNDVLVTLGVAPRSPHTGFGYICAGELIDTLGGFTAHKVARFKEKPSRSTARKYVAAGNYYWNTGMFFWKCRTFLDAIAKYLPDVYEELELIRASIGTRKEKRTIEECFERMRKVSVDHGILEKACNIAVLTTDLDWDDVGSYSTLYEYWPADKDGNRVRGNAITVNSENVLIDSPDRLVAAVGIKDIMIVDTGDAVLVCHRDAGQDVGRVVDELERRNRTEYL